MNQRLMADIHDSQDGDHEPKLFKCRVNDHIIQFKNYNILIRYILVTQVELSLASYEFKYIHIFTIITGSYSNCTH